VLGPDEYLRLVIKPEDINDFIFKANNHKEVVCMRVRRVTRGMAGKLYPEYHLHLDIGERLVSPAVLCATRKVKPGQVKYVIARDVKSLYQKSMCV
jgi:hypothetical protein